MLVDTKQRSWESWLSRNLPGCQNTARIQEQNSTPAISYAYIFFLINSIHHANVFPSCKKIGIKISWLISKRKIQCVIVHEPNFVLPRELLEGLVR